MRTRGERQHRTYPYFLQHCGVQALAGGCPGPPEILPDCLWLLSLAGKPLVLLREPFSSSSWGEMKLFCKLMCPLSAAEKMVACLGRSPPGGSREESACHRHTARSVLRAPPSPTAYSPQCLTSQRPGPARCEVTSVTSQRELQGGSEGGGARPRSPLGAVFCICD